MPLVALHNHPEVFRGADVLIFIDNMSALIGCIKGSSRVADSTAISGAIHILLAALGARAHFEWVPSASNPSDGLSRMGAADPLASSMGWELFGASLPPWRPNIHGYAHILQDMFGAKWEEL